MCSAGANNSWQWYLRLSCASQGTESARWQEAGEPSGNCRCTIHSYWCLWVQEIGDLRDRILNNLSPQMHSIGVVTHYTSVLQVFTLFPHSLLSKPVRCMNSSVCFLFGCNLMFYHYIWYIITQSDYKL